MASEKSLPGSLATKESIREFLGSKVEKAGRGAKKDSEDRTFRGVDVEEEQMLLVKLTTATALVAKGKEAINEVTREAFTRADRLADKLINGVNAAMVRGGGITTAVVQGACVGAGQAASGVINQFFLGANGLLDRIMSAKTFVFILVLICVFGSSLSQVLADLLRKHLDI